MKIAILVPTLYQFQGLDRVAWRQADALAQQGHKVTIFAFRGNMEPPENVTLEFLGMPRSFLAERIFRLTFPLNFVKAIKCIPKLKQFDLVYSHQYPMNWLAYLAKRLYRTAYIYYNHGSCPLEVYPHAIQRTYLKMVSFMERQTIKRAHNAISVSRYAQIQLKSETGLDSKVVYNGVDTQRFHKGINRSKVRSRYNLCDSPLVLFTGQILPQKAVHLLIKTFSLVEHDVPGAKLLIVGKHVYPAYSKMVRRVSNDSVILAGEIPNEELPYYYAACDVYATAALWESFNLPLVEAQACVKPVVAFNIGPHPEVVENGKTGFLVPARDVNALAEAIIKLLKDNKLRREMGENAYKAVKEKFSWDDIAQKTLEVYKEAVEARDKKAQKKNR